MLNKPELNYCNRNKRESGEQCVLRTWDLLVFKLVSFDICRYELVYKNSGFLELTKNIDFLDGLWNLKIDSTQPPCGPGAVWNLGTRMPSARIQTAADVNKQCSYVIITTRLVVLYLTVTF